MISLLNFIISKIKKEKFSLDPEVPKTYLIMFLINKTWSLINGFFIFRKKKLCFVHPTATIKCKKKINYGTNLSIERSCYIDALSKDGIIWGHNVSIGKFTTIECTGSLKSLGKGLIVGNNVGLGSHGFLGCAGGIEIGENTIFGNFVSLHSENHIYSDLEIPIRLQGVKRKGIKIGNNCWIGSKVTILDGAEIEDGCIIAAGAVIIQGLYQKNCIYGGVPGKLLKQRI